MKCFRNFLVHIYGGIADKVAFEVIKGRLGDFSDFIEAIEDFFTKIG